MSVKAGARTRAMRTFRSMGIRKFHDFNQRVSRSLTNNTLIPDWIWAANPKLPLIYLAATAKFEEMYHGALDGSKLLMSQRDLLQAQLVDLLDEMVPILEAAAVRNPDVLIASGLDLAKERRGRTRAKVPSDVSDSNQEGTDANLQPQ